MTSIKSIFDTNDGTTMEEKNDAISVMLWSELEEVKNAMRHYFLQKK